MMLMYACRLQSRSKPNAAALGDAASSFADILPLQIPV